MEFRIGVNLGDVIEEEETIYGDGVNVAARLEGLAEPGGVCISGTAFDQVRDKLDLGYAYLGEQSVKNIPRSVRTYKVLMEPKHAGELVGGVTQRPKHWRLAAGAAALVILGGVWGIWHFYLRLPSIEPASVEKMAFPLPDKPSIAVLPFDNLSGDPDQDYIADGISDSIIAALSKISEMFVIARNSTFTYKAKPVKVQQVSEDLGVRYVLEGSIQKSGDRVRVTSQLIDATTGHHLWSEQYDRDMKDLFDLQDEITHKIIVELQVKLTEGEQARVSRRSTDNLEAWSYAVRGLKLFERVSKENNAKAMELLEKAVELDPQYVWAWTRLAWTHLVAAHSWSPSPAESFNKAVRIAEKSVEMDESDSDVRALVGAVNLRQGNFDKALVEGETAIALGPTNAQAHVLLAVSMNAVGRFDDAIALVQKAMRLHPYYPAYYLIHLGTAYRMLGQYEDSLAAYLQLLERSQKGEFTPLGAHLYLAEVHAELGREEEARRHAEAVIRMDPNWSLKYVPNSISYRFRDPAHLKRRLAALRKAGLPEHPPLPLPDKPSIAVLPFENISGDPNQEYFSDGITEEIITALSKTPKLFVIARNSSFTYKGKAVWIPTVGTELGVRYILEGTVRKAGDKVRITAQLIDAKTNNHLWAERYDRDLKDIFAVQDDITKNIITELHVQLTEGQQGRIYAKATDNLDAYLKASEAKWYLRQSTKEGLLKARQLAEEVIALDPNYPSAYNTLAMFHGISPWIGLSKSPKESVKRAIELSQKAIALDDTFAFAHVALGYWLTMARQHERAIAEGERAVDLAPSSADVIHNYAAILSYAGRREEAIPLFRESLRLNPMPPNSYYRHFAMTLREAGQCEEAIAMHKKAIEREPNDQISFIGLTLDYAYANRMEEARAAANEVLRINPHFSADHWGKVMPNKDPAVTKNMVEALKKAGLK
jgi:adenylate cyclase